MKTAALILLLLAFGLSSFAADGPRPELIQTGKLSTARLLSLGRVTRTAPGGLRFIVLVQPNPGTTGQFTLKETRDFQLNGRSYQDMTEAELGQRYEPSTIVNTADKVLAQIPILRSSIPEGTNLDGAYLLAISIGGMPLTPPFRGEVQVHVGFGHEVETFTFPISANRPAAAKAPPKSPGAPRGPGA